MTHLKELLDDVSDDHSSAQAILMQMSMIERRRGSRRAWVAAIGTGVSVAVAAGSIFALRATAAAPEARPAATVQVTTTIEGLGASVGAQQSAAQSQALLAEREMWQQARQAAGLARCSAMINGPAVVVAGQVVGTQAAQLAGHCLSAPAGKQIEVSWVMTDVDHLKTALGFSQLDLRMSLAVVRVVGTDAGGIPRDWLLLIIPGRVKLGALAGMDPQVGGMLIEEFPTAVPTPTGFDLGALGTVERPAS